MAKRAKSPAEIRWEKKYKQHKFPTEKVYDFRVRFAALTNTTMLAFAKAEKVPVSTMANLLWGYTYTHVGGPLVEKRKLVLTDDQVRELRQYLIDNPKAKRHAIARQYGISTAYVSMIENGSKRKRAATTIPILVPRNHPSAAV